MAHGPPRHAPAGVDGRTATRHLRSALRICAVGGRLLAILPDGFDAVAFVEDQEQADKMMPFLLKALEPVQWVP